MANLSGHGWNRDGIWRDITVWNGETIDVTEYDVDAYHPGPMDIMDTTTIGNWMYASHRPFYYMEFRQFINPYYINGHPRLGIPDRVWSRNTSYWICFDLNCDDNERGRVTF